jgi:hypothetical protein
MWMSHLEVLPDWMVSHPRRRQILIMNTVNIKSQWFHFGISTCNCPAEVSDGKILVQYLVSTTAERISHETYGYNVLNPNFIRSGIIPS